MARGKIIFPIADGVEDLEYWVTRMRLEEEGYEVASAGLTKADVVGKNGLVIPVDLLLSEIDSSALLALVLAGGWAPDKLRRYSVVTDLIATANKEGKVIGAICHGGLMAISAKIVAGRRATGSLGIKDDLINAGAIWERALSTLDRRAIGAPLKLDAGSSPLSSASRLSLITLSGRY
ncbi:MAG: type 1 glutamine amidotransferase [Actinobacteria bacterium]|nr:type 1 glutamine amidotransferase [Actinomycetota bacterium]